MSRPASESLGAVKRARTASSCPDSVERPYLPPAPPVTPPPPPPLAPPSKRHPPDTPPPPPPVPLKHPRKRLRAPPKQDHTLRLQNLFHTRPSDNPRHLRRPDPPSNHHHQLSGAMPPGPAYQSVAPLPATPAAPSHYPSQTAPQHNPSHHRVQPSHDSARGKRTRPTALPPHVQRHLASTQHHQPQQQQHPPAPPHYTMPCEDDAEGHLIYKLGEGLHPNADFPHGRYKILSDLGEGTFGKVVECWDRREGRRVAIKVVRSVNKYREAARLEIDVLLHLNMHDPEGFYHCVKLYSWFDYRDHVCMVFEKLGPSLYEQLRRNRFQPFPLDRVREYAFQLLESVNFVHNRTLIHTDLKPENILLIDSKHSNAIKLIDFGSATFEKQHHSAVISTRHYRAPEVILGLGWTYPCDLWSIGCILVELYTGQALFQTHENLEHLAMMSGVLGPIPDSMIRRADGPGQKYFCQLDSGRSKLNWPAGASSKSSIRSVRRIQALGDIIRCPEAHANFFDLVRRLLAFEPDTRCTSAEALKHPFFREIAHESDPPLTTPTVSSGSSACGSHGTNLVRGRYKASSRRRTGVQKIGSSRGKTGKGSGTQRLEDEGEDTATEMPTAAEHSDHTVVAALSPRRPLGNARVA